MNKTTKAISTVTILFLISKPFAFLREMIVAAYYGATYQTDAYNMAIQIIALSTAILSAGVATVIIPMYNHKRIQQSKEEADLFANNILWITSLFYGVWAVIGIIFAPVLVKIFAPNFGSEAVLLTVNIIRIIFIFTIATNISNFLTSIAKIYDKFTITVVASYPLSIFTIAFTVLFAEYIGIYALVIAYVLFLLAQAALFVLSVRRVFKFKTIINFKNGDLKAVILLSLPVYLQVGIQQISAVIDKMLASGLPEGSISAMNYAERLRSLPDGIITASVITVMFPLLSQYAAKKDFIALKLTAVKTISLLSMVLLPIIAVCIYYANEITKIVFERGAFTPDDTALTANIFIAAVISLIFSGGASMLSNTFYGMQDTKTPQIAAIFMVTVDVTLNLILVRYLQAVGLVLATSIAYFVYFIVLFIQFRYKLGAFGGLALVKNVSKQIIAASVMIPVFFLCEMLRDKLHLIIFFGVSAMLSLVVYAGLLFLLKESLFIEVFERVKRIIKNRIKKTKL